MAWSNSTRRARLPKDWTQRVAAVKRRARGLCEANQHAPDCNGQGRDTDHITQGDDHSLANLQYLSPACHDAKTRAENAARNRLNARLKRRPAEPHPGARP